MVIDIVVELRPELSVLDQDLLMIAVLKMVEQWKPRRRPEVKTVAAAVGSEFWLG